MADLVAAKTSGGVISPFESVTGFSDVQRMAKCLCMSSMVPDHFRAKGNNDMEALANTMIAFQLSARMDIDVFQVMQNVYVIHGKPAFSSSFMIALINKSGKFSPLRFEYQRDDKGVPLACRAVAEDLRTKTKLVGPVVSMDMAKREGWSTKAGSKWVTMPEQMLSYRAASFWARLYAPDVILGMNSKDELEDEQYTPPVPSGKQTAIDTLNAAASKKKAPEKATVEAVVVKDPAPTESPQGDVELGLFPDEEVAGNKTA